MLALSPTRQALILFLLTLAILTPGIWEATALTGKDEFFLGLRTPMEMIEGGHWLVPFLDGVPRIRKPPLLYWLGRTSYELFGVSLFSARIVTVLFSALLVVSAGGIARHLTKDAKTGLITGCILLGCLGIATEGRRFMLDVPVTALSTAALWAFLYWLDLRRFYLFTVATVLLAAGFMTKGPIVALVFGGGCLALVASRQLNLSSLRPQLPSIGFHLLLWIALAMPWFFIVRSQFPEAASLVLADELESREFFKLSPRIFLGLLNVALPWVFVFALAVWQKRHESGPTRFVLFWFAATFLPFLIIKSFDRYLIGSLVPMAILLAISIPHMTQRWPYRLGASVALILGGALAGLCYWFHLGGWYWLLAPAAYLSWAWWQDRGIVHRLAAPAIFWIALLWGVFPALGVNAVPDSIVTLGKQQSVAMFDGPQPAMLPILSAHPQRHYAHLDKFDLNELSVSRIPIFVEDKDFVRFQETISGTNYLAKPLGHYQTLASHGSGLKFAKVGATNADWKKAFGSRSLAPLLTTVTWFEITPQ